MLMLWMVRSDYNYLTVFTCNSPAQYQRHLQLYALYILAFSQYIGLLHDDLKPRLTDNELRGKRVKHQSSAPVVC